MQDILKQQNDLIGLRRFLTQHMTEQVIIELLQNTEYHGSQAMKSSQKGRNQWIES